MGHVNIDSAKLSTCEKTLIALQLIYFPKDLLTSIFLSVTIIMTSTTSALQLPSSREKKNLLRIIFSTTEIQWEFYDDFKT